MPTRTPDERARARAEARRRARLAELADPADEEPAQAEVAPGRRGLIERLFPAAPPLPDRPDPLAGFQRTGPVRPLREAAYLLRRNPMAWVLPSLACSIGYYAASTGAGMTSTIGTFLTFGALIAAGWIGWQRPALYGTVTALIGFALVWTIVLIAFAANGGAAAVDDPGTLATAILVQGLIQGGLGFVGGWYGGYLRRRQAQVGAQARQTAAARRRR